MAIFSGGGLLRYLALGFGALLVGMQIGYTVHYTSVSSSATATDAKHRDAYEYMVALHDMQSEGLITDEDMKFLVAKHRAEVGGGGGSSSSSSRVNSGGGGPIPPPLQQIVAHPAAGQAVQIPNSQNANTGSGLRSVQATKQVAAAASHPPAHGLCDGGDPKEKKLVFIKTHKTGSSTVTNILHRVIHSYGYSPAVPQGNLYYAWPSSSEAMIVESVDPRIPPPYNIAGSGHSRYNRKAYDRIMGPDTHYVTVVRDPRSHIYSSWSYWSVPAHVEFNGGPKKLTAQQFIRDPQKYWSYLRQGDVDLLHNNMCYDLGACENDRNNYKTFTPINFRAKGTTVDQWVQQMLGEFSLIMITDYMDESLVLLKQLMCWTTKDIIYLGLKMKSKPRKGAQGSRPQRAAPTYRLTQAEVEAFAPIDVELYRYFNQTLWAKIEAQGDSFYDELHEYQDAMWEFSQKCRERLGSSEFSDDSIRYFLEDDPATPEWEKPCWEAVLDSGGFVKHLKREFGVDPSRTECIAQARNRHILQVRHDHPQDQELYKAMLQGVVEFQSTVDFTGSAALEQSKHTSPVFARCKPSFGRGGTGTLFHLASNWRYDQQNIKPINAQLGLKRVTVLRDPVVEFLHAWVKLDVGRRLLGVVRQKGQGKQFFGTQSFRDATTPSKTVPVDYFVTNANQFLPFMDEALGLTGKGEEQDPLDVDANPFGICDRVLFNRQTCKMHGPEQVQPMGNHRAASGRSPQGAMTNNFDAIMAASDLGGSLVLLRRWLCWPIELVSMISPTKWNAGNIQGYSSSLDTAIRGLNTLDSAVFSAAERQIQYHRDHSVGFRAEAEELEKLLAENEHTCTTAPAKLPARYKREIDGVDRITPSVQCDILKMTPTTGQRDLQSQAMAYFKIDPQRCSPLVVPN